ncbi:MAG TPA: hypothetical protein VD816_14410, partial [Ohtaekwangia sp.]|nr:hypothetical protein [Ohtaekwangia sp.]
MKNLLKAMVCLIFLGHQVCGQTGPGGVGNKDGTGGQPENVLWLKANAGLSSTGGLVDTWNDQSGNLNHAFGVGATRPSFVAAEAALNNAASIIFPAGGTLHSLVIPDANNLDNDANLTAFYVVRPTTAGLFNILSKRSGAGVEQSYLFNTTVAPNRFRTQISSGPNLSSGTYATSTNYFYSGVTAGASVSTFLNGNLTVSGAAPGVIPNSASDVYIGADGVLDNFEGSITEVVLYRAALNAAQRQIIENYLSAKYNIAFSTASNDVFAGDAPGTDFDFDLIGIGQQGGTTHTEAQAAGLVLAPANGTLNANNEFLLAAHRSATNVASVTNLGPGVQQRWSRDWYLDKTTSGSLDAFVSFDFSDGIGASFPQNKDNYVLLRLTAGTYQIVAIPNSSKSILGDRIVFNVANADLVDGIYTLGTTNLTQSPVSGVSNRTWYSYQSGNWTNPTVWTLDGGVFPLYVNPSNEIPGISDNVIITPGRIITANTNGILINSAQVDGTLDLAATTGHNFVTISGIGRIMMSGATDNFPAGDATLFADAAIGGTVEIYGAGTVLSQAHTFNDLEIEMNTAASVTTILNNITLNGDLRILNGLMQFNDNSSTTAKTFTVAGNVTVESSAGIRVGTANARHEFNLHGNFTNDGTALFTNRGAANVGAEATDGIVDVNFVSAVRDQTVLLNNTTNFYRIEINKGVDDTYKVSLTASAVSAFNLFGFANDSHGSVAQLATNGNALGLIYGTVEVGPNVVIPILSSTGNYNISAGAQLWVNGGTVNKNNGNAIVPYGKVRVTTGTLTALVNSGLTTRDNGQIIVEGGTLLTNQIRTSVNGIGNVGGYAQSGGDVVVNGDGPGGTSSDYYVFSLTYSGNTFLMSGGTLTVKGAKTGTGGLRGTFLINCDPANVNVTGGTV